jgi:DNA repair protein RAD50
MNKNEGPSMVLTMSTIFRRTTIIESLKFAVCGALPPGNKSGQAFVHDPRSIGQSVVKANVKLRFTNRAGSSMVVIRSMEVQQKKTTLSFKQLDGVLRSVDKDGNRISLGHKCSEMDKQIPLLLGCSKSILESVVFCHQEESSWPLQEGAVLKKRFDDIFDSTRYSKALDVFSKLKKEYASKVKDLKTDLAGLSSHRHAAKGFQQDVQKYNEQMEELEEQISEDKQGLKENEDEQARIQAIMEQVDEITNDMESRKNELTLQQQVSKKQKSMLHENLTHKHATRELKEMLRDFDSQMGNQSEKKADLEAEMAAVQKELAKIRTQETSLQSKIGRLQAEKESHEKLLKVRYEKMMEIGEVYALGDILSAISQTQPSQTQNTSYNASSLDVSMSGNTRSDQQPILDISQEDMDEFYRTLVRKEDTLKDALKSHRETHQQQEDQLQAQLSDLIGKLKSIENDREKLNREQTEARKELQNIGSQLATTTRVRKTDVENAKASAAKFAKERDELNSDPRRTDIPTEIRSLDEKIDKSKREIEYDQADLKDLRRTVEAQNAIAVLKEQCTKDLEPLQESIQEQSFVLQQYNITTPQELPGAEGSDENGDELTTAMEKVVDDISTKFDLSNHELSRSTEEANRLQQVVSEKSALLRHDQRALTSKRARMSQLDGPNGSIEKVRRVVTSLRQYEGDIGVVTPADINEAKPQELLSYLGNMLEESESQSTEGIQEDTVRKIFTRLKKQVRTDLLFGNKRKPAFFPH